MRVGRLTNGWIDGGMDEYYVNHPFIYSGTHGFVMDCFCVWLIKIQISVGTAVERDKDESIAS
jgi:hypothetical protein